MSIQNTEKEVTVNLASRSMKESSNAFLNYCLQCLKEVGDFETGRVPNHLSNTVNRNEKTSEELDYEDFIERVKLSINLSLSIKGAELRGLLATQSRSKSEYFKDNFLEYIINHKNVSFDGDKYHGIGKNVSPHQSEIDREGRIDSLLKSKP